MNYPNGNTVLNMRSWRPDVASREYAGLELTRDIPAPTGTTTHRIDYDLKPMPESRPPRAREDWTDRLFVGSSHERETYQWPNQHRASDKPLPEPHQEPAPWPVVSYHGRCAPGERAFRDTIIEQEEVKAWRSAKLVPERGLFHGECERKAATARREPLSRAGSCFPNRAKAPVQTNGPPDWTRGQSGSSYAWPRSDRKVAVKWRQHEKATQKPPSLLDDPETDPAVAGRPRDAPELDVALPRYGRASELIPAGGRGNGVAACRDRTTDFHTRNVADVLRPESAPAPRSAAGQKGGSGSKRGFKLMSAAEWRKQQKENARVAMPGGAREAAQEGRCGSLPAGVRGWSNPGRGFNTGAGTEPLRMGPTWQRGKGSCVETRDPRAPKVAAGVNMWHKIAASRYT